MPFYEYECSSCKFYSEVMQKITDAPLTKCPSCGKKTMVKLVSAPNFRLKGGGWYETDFKGDKESKRNLAGAEADEAPAAAESKPESSTETPKPEPAKAESGKTEAAAKALSAGSRKPKTAAGKASSGARASKPSGRAAPARAAAAKARPAPARKSKSAPARKKGRR